MNERCAEMAFKARHCAGLTRECASEILGIAPRTLAYYEGGRDIPDEIIARMVMAYKSPELGYHYLSNDLKTGRLILPPLEAAGISSSALRLRVVMRRATAVIELIEEICQDDVITADEGEPFRRCAAPIKELAAACMGIGLWALKKPVGRPTQQARDSKRD